MYGTVHFVYDQKDGFSALAQNVGHFLIHAGYTLLGVGDENYGVGLFDCQVYLLCYFFLENVVGACHVASRVYDGKFHAVPVALAVMPVACDSGRGVDYGLACLCQAVEKC